MGFDNECILNIQALAGEYFCPVCRLLVYPSEALQSQCTHLYCKPCLSYVVSTTRACPYDGYLVTEADAKPLVESNKTLADTIGKIVVHCLYHRSGCTWQGPLSDCTSHCSGCAFGNSPVVCNRCAVQIVHRQVQEHAQSCPGVQPQTQQADGALDTLAAGTSATADSQAATSQAQASQTTSATTPGSDPNQKANMSLQAQAAVPSAEHWYQQQQQQYQQYYQQYPGYDPYQQQNYYPYQQPAVPQSQQQPLQTHPPYGTVQHQPQPQTQPPQQPQLPQSQAQPQPQPQSQPPHMQASVAAQTQNQAQVNQQQQLHPAVQTYPAAHGQPHPQPPPYFQAPSHSQPHPQLVQMPQYQQPQIQQHTQSQLHPQHHPLSQPQLHSQPQPQSQAQLQHPSSHAMTGNHLYPQPHLHQPVQSGAAQQHNMHAQSQGVPRSQSQTPVPSQYPQQPALMRPPPSLAAIPNQPQPPLLPPPGQVQNINPAQQHAVHPYGQQPGNSVHQRPLMQGVQQPVPQQYFHHQPYVQQQPPTQLRPQSQSQSFSQHLHASTESQQNIALPQGIPHAQSNFVGRPMMPGHGVQAQQYAQTARGVQVRPMHPPVNHPSTNQNNMAKTNSLVQSGANSRPTMSERQAEQESELLGLKTATKVAHDLSAASAELKTVKPEMDVKSIDDEHKPTVEDKTNQGDTSSKELPESKGSQGQDPDPRALENGESVGKPMVKEEGVDSTMEHSNNGKLGEVVAEGAKDVPGSVMKQGELKELASEEAQLREEQNQRLQKDASGNLKPFSGNEGSQAVSTSAPTSKVQALHPVLISDQGKHLPPPTHHGPTSLLQRPGAPPLLQAPPPGPPHHTQGPGHPLAHLRPQGPAHVPGQPFHSSEHFPPAGGNMGFGASSGRASLYGPQGSIELQSVNPHGPYNQGHLAPPLTGAPRIQGEPVGGPPFGSRPPSGFDSHGGMMARAAPYGSEGQRNQQGAFGQPSGIHPNMLRLNGTPGFDSFTHGLRDERFKGFPDERLNPFPVDPTRRVMGRVEFEDDLKQFPRPSYLDSEPASKFGNHSSRPFVRGPHGIKYDSGPGGSVHANDAGDVGRMDPSRDHPDFVGRRLMDGMAPRSPVRDYPGIPSHGFSGFGPDDFDSREFHRFGDPLGNSFHDGRFSNLPSHFRRGEFEGPGNMRMDHIRNDLIGQDGHPGHLRRGEHLGPHNLPGDLHLREPAGFGARHSRMGDIAGPGKFESFRGNRPGHPRLGEPGFRSSFSLQRFPNDGTFTGDLESFDHSRKRKLASMGWCRICKVDCQTVEGLDLHSQTREHQKMAMDMVRSIKQNAKKQKLTSGDQSLVEDANKSKTPGLKAGEKSND